MAIYEKPVRLLMREMVEQLGLKHGELLRKQKIVEWFGQHYPKIKLGTINGHLNRLSTNDRNRLHHKGLRPKEDDLFLRIDSTTFRLYNADTDPPPIYLGEVTSNPVLNQVVSDVLEDRESESEFAYEQDLRNFLSKNLGLIEPGLKLYEEGDIDGVEFDVGGRFIDILAVDKAGGYVVVELKVSRGYERVVGQLLRYVAWIRQHQAKPDQSVRGVIIARAITADLQLACSEVSGITLYEYRLQIELQRFSKIQS